jgi:hypothetical protein
MLVLALSLAALPQAGAAGEGGRSPAVKPLFNVHRMYKNKKAEKLRFNAVDSSGKALHKGDVSFSMLHVREKAPVQVAAREVKDGVFEVRFAPKSPGLYILQPSVRGANPGSIAPVRLSVIGVQDGLIEVSPQEDGKILAKAKSKGYRVSR